MLTKRFALFLLSVIVIILCVFNVLAYPDSLNLALSENPYFPWGTIVFWIIFTLWPAVFYFGIKGFHMNSSSLNRTFKKAFQLLIILGLLWGIIGFGLADNWAYNFKSQEEFRGSSRAGVIYMYFNYFLLIAPLASGLVYLISNLISIKKRHNHE